MPGPDAVRPYARASWSLASIRSCSRHRTALVPLEECLPGLRLGGVHVYDFAQAMWSLAGHLGRIGEHAVGRMDSPFEAYLLARLWGPKVEVTFLDALPWYAAARSCEMVGAVSLAGSRFRTAALSEAEWFRAGIEGFRILSGGEASIWDCLERLRASSSEAGKDAGLRATYGRLYEWLAHEDGDETYAPLRRIIREHALETLPLGPGDELFGEPVTERRLHSIRYALIAVTLCIVSCGTVRCTSTNPIERSRLSISSNV